MIDISKVRWYDDFIGVKLHPAYSFSNTPGGFTKVAQSVYTGGWWHIGCTNVPAACMRVHLGDLPTYSPYDCLTFNMGKNLHAKARQCLNMADKVQDTIGFIGLDDPANVFAAIYNSDHGNTWLLQTNRDMQITNTETGWSHTPGVPFEFEFRSTAGWGELWINGELKARSESTLPVCNLAWEYQIWNRPVSGGWSSPVKTVDVLAIEQDR